MASQVENIKWVPGTKFLVDGFGFVNPRCQQYFLTHCHSDHTTGLTKSFSAGTIWCSAVSARLLAAEWGLKAPVVQQLQLHEPVVIDGVTVTALDANHCPGAIMLLFEVPSSPPGPVHILHTGDCRWHDGLHTSSCLAHKPIDTLMLDTTYALPKHTFPPQDEAISMMVELMREALTEEPDTLMVVSCYHIGKERAFLGAAAALGLKVYVKPSKMSVLQLLGLPDRLMAVLSDDASSQLHVGCTSLAPDELLAYLAKQQEEQQQQEQGRRWKCIMGFRATGWAYRRSGGLHVQRPHEGVALVGIPYSEHSSWQDLRQCVATLRPKKLIPTVNAATRSEQQALVDRFADLMDLSCDRGRIDAYLVRRSSSGGGGRSAGAAAAAVVPLGEAACGVPASNTPALAAAAATAAEATAAAAGFAPAAQQFCQDGRDDPPTLVGNNCGVGRRASTSSSSSSSSSSSDVVMEEDEDKEEVECVAVVQSAAQQQGRQRFVTGSSGHDHHDDEAFDFGGVDVSEQQRLLDDAERRQRLRRSLLLQQQQQQKGRSTTRRGGGGKQQPSRNSSKQKKGVTKKKQGC